MRQKLLVLAMLALIAPAQAMAKPATPAKVSAKEMAQSVATALRESGQLQNYKVGVKYDKGVAWLYGEVTSQEQAKKAAQLAKQVSGVKRVVNRLDVIEPVAEPALISTEADDISKALAQASPAAHSKPVEPAKAVPPTPLINPVANPMAQPLAQPEVAPMPAAKSQVRQKSRMAHRGMPRPIQRTAGVQPANYGPQHSGPQYGNQPGAMPIPQGYTTGGAAGVSYDQANMPNYAWPSYAAYPNYSAVTYPKQYSPAAWPYIGPFYPYPQVPLGWRKVTLEWDDGWWQLDFSHQKGH